MKVNILAIALFVVLGFSACKKKENNITPTPVTSANIIGSVNLFDEGIIATDPSNMTVSIEGTSYSANTDASGDFVLSGIPFGTYTLVYEKPGYGTYKKFNFVHSNTGSSTVVTETPSLGQNSTTQVSNLSANATASEVNISITTSPAGSSGNTRYFRYFLSTSSAVGFDNYNYVADPIPSQINPYTLTITMADLINLGFASGQTIYIKVYGESFWSNVYQDPNAAIKTFPNLNTTAANAVSFTIP